MIQKKRMLCKYGKGAKMKKIKINKVRILSITIFLVTLIILIGIINSKIIKNDNSVIQSQYQAGTDDGSELVSNYIKEGVQVGGIVGKLKTLDTSDATATPEDITKGKTAYVNGVKITGTYEDPIPDLNSSNTIFSQNISYWTNQSVTVTVSTTVSGYTLQTTTGNPNIESNWSITSKQVLNESGTVYARLTDGEKSGNYTSYNVTNIDTTLPRYLGKGRIAISRNNSQRRVVLQLNTIADADSGIAKVVYYYKKDTDSYFTASDPINYATINGTEKGPNGDLYYSCIANFDSDITNNTVYMYAKIYDVAGNVINTALATISPGDIDTTTSYGDAPYVD